jgi:uncharacterized protein involved in cysteine biosynthesis
MAEVLRALNRALKSLLRPIMFWHALWPPIVALLIWIGVATQLWTPAKFWLTENVPQLPWQGWGWLADWLAQAGLLLVLAPLVYFTAILLVATFALPRMMSIVAAADYPELERRGRDAVSGSLINTLAAGLVYVVGWIVTMPLLLVPGGFVVLPIVWAGWLNQRTFRFDSLADHATPEERRTITAGARGPLYLAGFVTALMAHVPLLNVLAPAFTALVYVHLCLAALRRQRSGEIV